MFLEYHAKFNVHMLAKSRTQGRFADLVLPFPPTSSSRMSLFLTGACPPHHHTSPRNTQFEFPQTHTLNSP
jgi:hypothetical protein